MATNLLPIQTLTVRASAVSGHRATDNRRLKTTTSTTGNGGGSWWSPLFGWSSDADYIDSNNSIKKEDPIKSGIRVEKIADPEAKPARSRFTPGCFTEEKAKRMRLMTKETETFHDAMYHSAIASRLASDFSHLSDL